jgi:UDP-N-acetylmuramoyl-L-alanyl-D-glutamate--2,6-diaminopimelate ligase
MKAELTRADGVDALHAAPTPKRLVELAALIDGARVGGTDLQICGLCQDSRKAVPGVLFALRDGVRHRGVTFLDAALEAGARAFLVAEGSEAERAVASRKLPFLAVPALEPALGTLAQACFDFPARRLRVVGVTGTNGKTTTVSMLRQALTLLADSASGDSDSGVGGEGIGVGYTVQLGTLGLEGLGLRIPTGLTTPGPEVIAEYMALALKRGAKYFAMEVSSHAAVQQRVAGIAFSCVAFSNLTRDHLDFHGTMEAYEAAKFGFVEQAQSESRAVNIDDARGAHLAALLAAKGLPVTRVGRAPEADVRLLSVRRQGFQNVLTLAMRGSQFETTTELVGAHNCDNLLLTLGILLCLGVGPAQMMKVVPKLRAAPGRLEACEQPGDPIRVLVDYAHTPDALERALAACRAESPGRLLLVFGCGGDRDPGKRKPMGEIAGTGSELCWVSNDNPRTEAPSKIADAIVEGLNAVGGRYRVCLDRAQAIHEAIVEAKPGDVVLIAGKGHEDYQIIGEQTLPFDDRDVARAALAERRGSLYGARN